jgi:hypothetical protein
MCHQFFCNRLTFSFIFQKPCLPTNGSTNSKRAEPESQPELFLLDIRDGPEPSQQARLVGMAGWISHKEDSPCSQVALPTLST